MSKLIIEGGKPVSGTHRVSGNKNAALPMIAAALLADEPVTVTNLPDIEDVASMLEAAESFGAEVVRDRKGGHDYGAPSQVRRGHGGARGEDPRKFPLRRTSSRASRPSLAAASRR